MGLFDKFRKSKWKNDDPVRVNIILFDGDLTCVYEDVVSRIDDGNSYLELL